MNIRSKAGNKRIPAQIYLFTALILLFYVMAVWWTCRYQVSIAKEEFRLRLQNQVTRVAQTINPSRVEQLLYTKDDKDNPAYNLISLQLSNYLQVVDCRGIYTIAKRNGSLVFGPESYEETDPQASPPGTVYLQPSSKLLEHFDHPSRFVEGPYRDEYGSFISAYAPIRHPVTGEFLMMVGIDAEVTVWQKTMREAWIKTIGYACIISVFLLGGALALILRPRMSTRWKRFFKNGEVFYVALAGLLLTLITANFLHDKETRSKQSVFIELSGAHMEKIINSFYTLRDHKLNSVALFCKHSKLIEAEEFKGFSSSLIEERNIESIFWVPAVDKNGLDALITWMRQTGFSDFKIYSSVTSEAGETESVRSVYYPIQYAEPSDRFQSLLGFDLGSDRQFRDIFEQVQNTGFQMSFYQNSYFGNQESQANLRVIIPVKNADEETSDEKGCLIAAININRYFEMIFPFNEYFPEGSIDLYLLDKTKEPELVYSLKESQNRSFNDWMKIDTKSTLVFPLFLFGKTYAVFVESRYWLTEINLSRTGDIFVWAGVLTTIMVTIFVGLIIRNRSNLENEVQNRTGELIEREQLLWATLRSIGDGVICTDNHGRITNINLVAESLTGWSKADAYGRPVSDVFRIIDNQTGDPVVNPVEKVLATGIKHVLESNVDLVSKNGAIIQIADSCAPILDKENRTVGAVQVFRDITAEHAQKKELIRVNKAIESTSDGIGITDLNFVHFYQNPSFTKLFGYSQSELVSLGREIVFEDKDIANSIFSTLATGGSWSGEVEMQDKTGKKKTVFFQGDTVKDETGKHIAYIALFKDITEKRRYENELLKSQERYKLAADGSNDGMWDWDLITDDLFLSPQWKKMIGFTDSEMPSAFTVFDERLHPDDKVRVITLMENFIDGKEESYRSEFRFRHKDGSYRWILARAEALRDSTGRAYRLAGSHADITEQKQAEATLRETNLKLEEAIVQAKDLAEQAARANDAKGDFLANVSHEIRTPISGVIGMTQILLESNLTPDQHHYAKLACTTAKSLLTIIDDILDFSKIDAGKIILENTRIDITSIVENVTDFLAVEAEEKGLDIVALVDDSIPEALLGDPGRIRQILINLGGNAIKFTHSGSVSIRAVKEGESETGVTVVFKVQDTGEGIPVDKQDGLFQPFTQGDSSASRKYGGSGLGLAICRQLVEAMKGAIDFTSTENKGSEFFFSIHFTKVSGTPRVQDIIVFEEEKRVLVVENSMAIQAQIETFVAKTNIRITTSASGKEALKILHSAAIEGKPFQAIIVGRQLSDIAVEAFVKHVENIVDEPQPSLVLLMPTRHVRENDAEITRMFNKILKKPIKKRDLLVMLKEILDSETTEQFEQSTLDKNDSVSPKKDSSSKPIQVLLVEDHPVIQLVIQKMLLKMKCQTTAASNGLEALEILKTTRFDIVLMDCQMPKMDGFEATRQIRNPQTGVLQPEIPIVALTAHAGPDDRKNCLEAGMSDYLSKPVEYDHLERILKKFCPDFG